MSVIPHEWEAALLYCVSVVAPVNRKPMKRKKRQIVKDSTNSAGCNILNDLGKSIWENSVGSVGKMKAKAQDFLVYRDTRLRSKSPALCAGLKPDKGTRRDMEDAEAPMAAAEAAGGFATGNKSKEIKGGGEYEEDLHSGLDLFWGTVALSNWKDVFCCGIVLGFFYFGG